MARLTRVLLVLCTALLALAPVAQARAKAEQTLRFRVPVPAAADFSILTFELRIGGEGKQHRKQPVTLDLVNHKQSGVFALARLGPEPGHPGRFLGIVDVFHRSAARAARAATAGLPSGLTALSHSAPLARAHAASPFDELLVRAINEHVIKETIKDNIEEIAERHELGSDEFCDPEDEEEYLLGNAVIGTAYIQAGSLLNLPTHTSANQLARDAVEELCDDIEDEAEGGPEDEGQYPGMRDPQRLSRDQSDAPRRRRRPTYRLGFKGAWAFAAAALTIEVQLVGAFTGDYPAAGPPPSLRQPAERDQGGAAGGRLDGTRRDQLHLPESAADGSDHHHHQRQRHAHVQRRLASAQPDVLAQRAERTAAEQRHGRHPVRRAERVLADAVHFRRSLTAAPP